MGRRGISSVASALIIMAIVLIASLAAYMMMLSRIASLGASLASPEESPFTFTASIYPAEVSTGYRYFISIAISSGYQELKRFAVLILYSTPYGQSIAPVMGFVESRDWRYSPPALETSYIEPSWDRSKFDYLICSRPGPLESLYRVSEVSTLANAFLSCWIAIPPGEGVHIGVHTVLSTDNVNTPVGVFVCSEERCKYQGLESSRLGMPPRIPATPPWPKDTTQCTVVASWYGSHGPSGNFWHSGRIRLVSSRAGMDVYYEIVVRQQETTGWEAVALGVMPPGSEWFWLTPEGFSRLSSYARIVSPPQMRAYQWPGGYAWSTQDFDRFFASNPPLIWSGSVDKIYFYEFDSFWIPWWLPYSPFPFQQKDYFATYTTFTIQIYSQYEGDWWFAIDSDDAADVLVCEIARGGPRGSTASITPQLPDTIHGGMMIHSPVAVETTITSWPVKVTIVCTRFGAVDSCKNLGAYPWLLSDLSRVSAGPMIGSAYSYNFRTYYSAYVSPTTPQARGGDLETPDPIGVLNPLSAPGMKLVEPAGYYGYTVSQYGSFPSIINITASRSYKMVEQPSGGVYHFYTMGPSSGINALWGYDRSVTWSEVPDVCSVAGCAVTKYWISNEYGLPNTEDFRGRPLDIKIDTSVTDQLARFPGLDTRTGAPYFIAYIDPGISVGGQGNILICYPYPGAQNYLPIPRCSTMQTQFIIPDYTKQSVIQGRSLDPLITVSKSNYALNGLSVDSFFEYVANNPRWRSIGYYIEAVKDMTQTPINGPIKYFVAATIPVQIIDIPGKGRKAIYGATAILIAVDTIEDKAGIIKITDPIKIAKMTKEPDPWFTDVRKFYLLDLNDFTQNNTPPSNAPTSGYFLIYWDSYSFNPQNPLKFSVGQGYTIAKVRFRIMYATPAMGIYGYYCRLDQPAWNPLPPLLNPYKSNCYNFLNQVIYDWKQTMFSLPNVPTPWPPEFASYVNMGAQDPFTGLNAVTYPSPAFAVALIPVN